MRSLRQIARCLCLLALGIAPAGAAARDCGGAGADLSPDIVEISAISIGDVVAPSRARPGSFLRDGSAEEAARVIISPRGTRSLSISNQLGVENQKITGRSVAAGYFIVSVHPECKFTLHLSAEPTANPSIQLGEIRVELANEDDAPSFNFSLSPTGVFRDDIAPSFEVRFNVGVEVILQGEAPSGALAEELRVEISY